MALDTNLVAAWNFNESSGNAVDSSPNGNTLTNNNSTAFTTGKIGNAANLVRNNSNYFSIASGSQTGLSMTGDMSFSFWMNPSGNMNESTVPVLIEKNTGNDYGVYMGGGGGAGTPPNLNFTWRFLINGGEKDFATTHTTGTWYHIVHTFKASTGAYNMYVNGSNVSSQTFAGSPITVNTSSTTVRVGWDTSGTRFFDGLLDMLYVWSRELSSSEVTSLYNGGSGLAYPFSVAYTLTAAQGSFTLTGQAANLLRPVRNMVAAMGSFVLSGQAATFRSGKGLFAATGYFILTGIAAILRKSGWSNQTKHTSSYSNQTRHSSSWTNQTKHH